MTASNVGALRLPLPASAAASAMLMHVGARPPPHFLAAAAADDKSGRRSAARSRSIVASAVTDTIEKQVAENKVMVYSKSYCPFCAQTKTTLDSMGIEYTAVELD